MRDTLAGDAALNWSADVPIWQWDGIWLQSGDIPRSVEVLDLEESGLTGTIPPELGNLISLEELFLGGNALVGCVPDDLVDVQENDLDALGLPLCSDAPPLPPLPDCVVSLLPISGPAPSDFGIERVGERWTDECVSVESPGAGEGDSYARFYAFTLAEAAAVTVILTSEDIEDSDTRLYVRSGHGTDGAVVAENDDHGTEVTSDTQCADADTESLADYESCVRVELQPGDYTIEATTYNAMQEGEFSLIAQSGEAVQPEPDPDPDPEPDPPASDIEAAVCNADDLAHLGDYTTQTPAIAGPGSYDDNYFGQEEYYRAWWYGLSEADGLVIYCIARRYDSIHNARWHGLNYSTVLQRYGTGIENESVNHKQEFISPLIGDDTLALSMEFTRRSDGNRYKAAEVRFLNAEALTVTTVYLEGIDAAPDISLPEGIARSIASRVMSSDGESQNQAQGLRQSMGFVE